MSSPQDFSLAPFWVNDPDDAVVRLRFIRKRHHFLQPLEQHSTDELPFALAPVQVALPADFRRSQKHDEDHPVGFVQPGVNEGPLFSAQIDLVPDEGSFVADERLHLLPHHGKGFLVVSFKGFFVGKILALGYLTDESVAGCDGKPLGVISCPGTLAAAREPYEHEGHRISAFAWFSGRDDGRSQFLPPGYGRVSGRMVDG